MRKISLDVNELRVESFETVDEKAKERGTVEAYDSLDTCQTQCGHQCLSGWRPCEPTDAFTDGRNWCYCGGSVEYLC